MLEELRSLDPTIVCIVFTGFATIGSAVEAMQRGAYDFPPKPFTPEEFRAMVRRGLEQRALYGPTGRMEWVGPVGQGTLEPYAYDKDVMTRLWQRSEADTGCRWTL